jgi:hypothetical protein
MCADGLVARRSDVASLGRTEWTNGSSRPESGSRCQGGRCRGPTRRRRLSTRRGRAPWFPWRRRLSGRRRVSGRRRAMGRMGAPRLVSVGPRRRDRRGRRNRCRDRRGGCLLGRRGPRPRTVLVLHRSQPNPRLLGCLPLSRELRQACEQSIGASQMRGASCFQWSRAKRRRTDRVKVAAPPGAPSSALCLV